MYHNPNDSINIQVLWYESNYIGIDYASLSSISLFLPNERINLWMFSWSSHTHNQIHTHVQLRLSTAIEENRKITSVSQIVSIEWVCVCVCVLIPIFMTNRYNSIHDTTRTHKVWIPHKLWVWWGGEKKSGAIGVCVCLWITIRLSFSSFVSFQWNH